MRSGGASGQLMLGPVLILALFAKTSEPVYHNQFAVHVTGGQSKADEVAARHGFVNLGQIGTLLDHYLLEHPRVHKRSTDESLEHTNRLKEEPDVRWFEQQRELRRVKRDAVAQRDVLIPDPMFKNQWFINHGAADGSDMNVQPAWRRGFTGKGVVVTILDDGIQTNHPDLVLNYDPEASTDINDNDDDPMPQDNGDNKHGTRCAGEVAAEAFNNVCGVGIAFNASVGGVRMLDGVVNDAVEARALSLNPNHIDIYSASWGPEDDGKTVDGPGPLAKKAFINGIKDGRHGKGSIFVWASGNGGRKNDNCNCDGYTNSIFTLSISSATQGGRKPWYLEECSSTLASTYSSGTPSHDASITTVDQDARLRKDKICTSFHTGTSASAPIAAGICALALEANPQLSWRDMQHIVVLTSNPKPLLHESGWMVNGVGRQYSLKFGYGLMDADAIVELAQDWPGSGKQLICETDTLEPNVAIPANNEVARVSITTSACAGTAKEIRFLEHVQCKVTLKFNPRGALELVLTSPRGTKSSLLLPRPRDKTNAGFDDWPFLSVHFWGEPSNGTWMLDVYRSASVPATGTPMGIIKKWKLIFYGTRDSVLKDVSALDEDIDSLIDSAVDKGDDEEDVDAEQDSDATEFHPEVYLNQTSSSKIGPDGCSTECSGGCIGGTGQTHCTKCKNYKYHCETCKKHKYDTLCTSSCPRGTFSTVKMTCEVCHVSCVSCYGPLESQCLACKKGWLLEDGHQSNCVSKCLPGYRLDEEERKCVKCPETCQSCSASSDNIVSCNTCRLGLVLSAEGQDCLGHCPTRFFLNPKSRRCEFCDSKCATCTGPLETQCSLCREGTFFYQRKCVSDCPVGYHPNRRVGECVPCSHGCASCSSDDSKCVKCLANWEKDPNTHHCAPKASKNCSPGSFSDVTGGKCRPCHETCASCQGSSEDRCLSCFSNHLLHISSCVDDGLCPQSTFPSADSECRHCPHACKHCKDMLHCTTCQEGYALSGKGLCVANCADTEHNSGGVCQQCHSDCKTCDGIDLRWNSCLSCPAGKFLLGGQCLQGCPPGHFESKNSLWCLKCHPSCLGCFGENANQCVSCPAGKKLVGDTCVGCGSRSFYDASACSTCHQSCEACTGPKSTDCAGCHPPMRLNRQDNTCVPCCEKDKSENCCQCSNDGKFCLEPESSLSSSAVVNGRRNRSFREDIIGSSSRSALLFLCLVASMATVTFIVLNVWKKRKRRLSKRRQQNGDADGGGGGAGVGGMPSWRKRKWRRGGTKDVEDNGRVPLMTMVEEEISEDENDAEEYNLGGNSNGAVNGQKRHLAYS